MLFRQAISRKVMFALQYILYSFKFLAKKISGNGSLIHKLHTKALCFNACQSEKFRDLVINVTISFARRKMAAAVQVVTYLAGNKQIVHRS